MSTGIFEQNLTSCDETYTYNFWSVLRHEFGHGMGLDHSTLPCFLMYTETPYNSENVEVEDVFVETVSNEIYNLSYKVADRDIKSAFRSLYNFDLENENEEVWSFEGMLTYGQDDEFIPGEGWSVINGDWDNMDRPGFGAGAIELSTEIRNNNFIWELDNPSLIDEVKQFDIVNFKNGSYNKINNSPILNINRRNHKFNYGNINNNIDYYLKVEFYNKDDEMIKFIR